MNISKSIKEIFTDARIEAEEDAIDWLANNRSVMLKAIREAIMDGGFGIDDIEDEVKDIYDITEERVQHKMKLAIAHFIRYRDRST